jgi:hypothetical protein
MWFTGINYYKLAVEIVTLFLRPLRPYRNQDLDETPNLMEMQTFHALVKLE